MYTTKIWWHEYNDPNSPLVLRTSIFEKLADAFSEVRRYQSYELNCEAEIENCHGDTIYFDNKGHETLHKHQDKNTPEPKDKGEKEHE